MLALKNAFSADAAAGLRLVLEVRFGTGSFRVTVDDSTIAIGRGSSGSSSCSPYRPSRDGPNPYAGRSISNQTTLPSATCR